MKLTEFTSVCNVTSFDFSLDQEQIETTSLSCGCSTANNGLASFKTYQAGFIDGTGSVEVQFTADQGSMAPALSVLLLRRTNWVRKFACISTRFANQTEPWITVLRLHRSTRYLAGFQLQR